MLVADSLFTDERDAIQKKTFTKWVNKHLKKVRLGNKFKAKQSIIYCVRWGGIRTTLFSNVKLTDPV